jgi:ABC-type Mn2+/Zn2+ transport system permease subunit
MISLQYSLVIFVFVTFVTWLCVYLDGRFTDHTKTKGTYIKSILMTNAISFAVIYILLWASPNNNINDVVKPVVKLVGGSVAQVAQIGEEMLTGPAPF